MSITPNGSTTIGALIDPAAARIGNNAGMSRLVLFVPGLLLVLIASVWVLFPNPVMADIRAAERLWRTGRVAEARRQLLAIERQGSAPTVVNVRLAAIALLRGECADAQTRAATALLNGNALRRDEAAQMHLVAGQCAALSGNSDRAEAEWASVDARSPLRFLADVLRGEQAFRAGRASVATTRYQAALNAAPPEPWRSLVHLRLALLNAADAPAEAAQNLAAIAPDLPAPDTSTTPFLPIAINNISVQARQLSAILPISEPQRSLLLGQQLLDLGVFRLAIDRFERAPLDAPESLAANAQAAYARWQLGQTGAAATQLKELAGFAPQQPLVATLYATVALHENDLDGADAALDRAEQANPLDPAIALVRSDVLAARREYARAMSELRRARDIAQPDARSRYALALVAQHLNLTYDVCGSGVVAGREASTIAPNDPAAWQMLATVLYHCRLYAEAADAARTGLQLAPDTAALHWFLGAALHELGDPGAQAHLVRAADLAPADEWRQRAEQLLGW